MQARRQEGKQVRSQEAASQASKQPAKQAATQAANLPGRQQAPGREEKEVMGARPPGR